MRRMLFEHYDTSAGSKPHRPPDELAGSFTAALGGPDDPPLAWCAFGLPRAAVYFPVWLDGDLPAALHGTSPDGVDVWQQTRDLLALADDGAVQAHRLSETLERVQTTFEQDVEELLPQARALKRQGEELRLRHQTTAMMQRHIGLFAKECRALLGGSEVATPQAAEYAEEFVGYFA